MMKNNFLSLEKVAKAGINTKGPEKRSGSNCEPLAMPISERTGRLIYVNVKTTLTTV